MKVRRVLPRDAIPSVDAPTFGDTFPGDADDPADPGDSGDPSDSEGQVVVVEAAEPPRAYPLRYLHFYEIVNDVVGEEPIAVTWCPLCGSAVVYDRCHEGRTLTFGVSGKLADDDDLVMYDRETESDWKQSTGECIAGPLEGESLTVRSGAVLPIEQFRDVYPDGLVLQPPGGESEAASDDETPEPIDYDQSPYAEYFEMDGFGLDAHREDDAREWDRDDEISPKTVVLGMTDGDAALGFPFPRVLEAGGIVQRRVGGTDVLVVAAEEIGIHGFVDPGHAFEWAGNRIAADGTTWDPVTGRAADGRRLDRLPTRRLFAFTWQDDHGPDAFYSQP